MTRTRTERLDIVAYAADSLWQRVIWVTSEQITDEMLSRPEWDQDGYDGEYPWTRANRYVMEYLREMKHAGRLVVQTTGSAHYNNSGTMVEYRLCGLRHEAEGYGGGGGARCRKT